MDNDTVIRLRRVVLRLARQLNAASREEGLTPTEASVLGIASTKGPLSLAELTDTLKSTVRRPGSPYPR